uniref:CUB domain-containing protein n=1 Tax=Macrostomum lignano TaxID=282301 RepID=A0A1I8JAH8_9PLAT
NGTFFVKFDEFENHLGLKADHANCDSGRPCDPKFIIEFPITIGIKVKECLFDLDRDEIADFFQQLDDLPRPFLHGEPFDPDSDRIRKLELGSLAPAPISINATTVQATTKTTVTSSTAATGTSPSVSTESKSASSLLQSTTSTRTSQSVSMNSGEVNQASDVQPSIVQVLSSRLDLVLVVILMLVVIGIITAVTSVLLCSRRRRRRRPILVSGVSYNRDGIGLDLPLGTSGVEGQYPQLPNCTNPAYITSTERQQMQYGQEQSDRPGRPDSGVYEEPIDFSERNLPPLPARGVGAATFSRKI